MSRDTGVVLCDAWMSKAAATAQTLRHMQAAPALFKPEHVGEVLAEHRRALAWARYWSEVGA